jgi:hypothetical protein
MHEGRIGDCGDYSYHTKIRCKPENILFNDNFQFNSFHILSSYKHLTDPHKTCIPWCCLVTYTSNLQSLYTKLHLVVCHTKHSLTHTSHTSPSLQQFLYIFHRILWHILQRISSMITYASLYTPHSYMSTYFRTINKYTHMHTSATSFRGYTTDSVSLSNWMQ